MSLYRKKPVVIEAWCWGETLLGAPDWLTNNRAVTAFRQGDFAFCQIATLEGTMLAEPGDWIIKGIADELYPCKPEIFAATYAPASEPEGWQPIETAPKDGRDLMLHGDGMGFAHCTFIGYFGRRAGWPGDEPKWRRDSCRQAWDVCGPTHWQPLPEPPLPAEQSVDKTTD